jgi:hypothetical protein
MRLVSRIRLRPRLGVSQPPRLFFSSKANASIEVSTQNVKRSLAANLFITTSKFGAFMLR